MIFKIKHTVGDNFGNTMHEGPDEYIEAGSAEQAWKKLGSPAILSYWMGDKYIPRRLAKKNAKHLYLGDVEFNPLFNWNRDSAKATSFESSMGLSSIEVEPLTLRK